MHICGTRGRWVNTVVCDYIYCSDVTRVSYITVTSQGCNEIWNHQQLDCLFNSLLHYQQRNYQISALLALCEGNPLVAGGFPTDDPDWWVPHRWPRSINLYDITRSKLVYASVIWVTKGFFNEDNFQTNFSDRQLRYLLWYCPQVIFTGPHWW